MRWSTHSRRIDPINRSAKAFCQGDAGRNRLVSYAHGAQSTRDDGAKDAIPIADEIARSLVPRESLCDLTRNPFRCRMSGDVGPDKGSAVEPDDDEDIEQGEADGRDDEQIHCGDMRGMIGRKARHPWLGGPRRLTMYLATVD